MAIYIADPCAGAHVLFAEPLNDRVSARRCVSNYWTSGRLLKAATSSGGKEGGSIGKLWKPGLISNPQISQCPVMVSLPMDCSSIAPYDARGCSAGGIPGIGGMEGWNVAEPHGLQGWQLEAAGGFADMLALRCLRRHNPPRPAPRRSPPNPE
jgi:hypothetical protein